MFENQQKKTRMRAKRASEFRKIPQRSAIFRKTPQSSAECRKMPRNTVNSAEFCGTRILASLASSLMFCVILQITKLNVKLLNESDCVQHYPTSTVTDLLMNLESSHKCDLLNQIAVDAEDIDPKSLYYGAIYEVEAWLKYGKIRRKLDLVAKCHPKKTSGKKRGSLELEIQEENEDEEESVLHLTASQERLFEADRDYIAHDTVVQDMCAYLRKKGINNPEEMLSLPVR